MYLKMSSAEWWPFCWGLNLFLYTLSNLKYKSHQIPKLKCLVLFYSCLCPIHWSQVLSWEWRCSWSSTNRPCSNYIWVINYFIAYHGAAYIRVFTVYTSLRYDTVTRWLVDHSVLSVWSLRIQNFSAFQMELLDFLNRQTINRAIIDLEIGKDKKFAFVTVGVTTVVMKCWEIFVKSWIKNISGQITRLWKGCHFVGGRWVNFVLIQFD